MKCSTSAECRSECGMNGNVCVNSVKSVKCVKYCKIV